MNGSKPVQPTKPGKTSIVSGVKDIHVKNVPVNTWRKARQQALATDMSFRDFVIRLLDHCEKLIPGVFPMHCIGGLEPFQRFDACQERGCEGLSGP